jgi:hypothetical protein
MTYKTKPKPKPKPKSMKREEMREILMKGANKNGK